MRSYFGRKAFDVAAAWLLCVCLPAAAGAADVQGRAVRGELVVLFRTTRAARAAGSQVRAAGLDLLRRRAHSRLGLIGFASRIPAGAAGIADAGEVEVTADYLRQVDKACRDLAGGEDIEVCQPNYIYAMHAVPNDPQYSKQYGPIKISCPAAWNVTTGSRSVVVAVIDTGVDYTHPDLAANIWKNTLEIPNNGRDDDANGLVDDYFGYDFYARDPRPLDEHGHGTHVAGIIGAAGNNGIGVAGVAWRVRILPVRVLGRNGTGSDYAVASGVEYAARRAHILNLSLGTPSYSQSLYLAVQGASRRGRLIVAAAGNKGSDNDVIPDYPANFEFAGLISVAAVDSSDGLWASSNYGAASVDLAAPGAAVASTYPQKSYSYMSGTSMAAPHVSGTAALMKAVNGGLSGAQLKQEILRTVDKLTGLQGRVAAGGRLNAYRAVQRAKTLAAAADVRISLGVLREDSASVTAGGSVTRNGAALGAYAVQMTCGGGVTGSTRTDSRGRYAFRIIRPISGTRTCYMSAAGAPDRPRTVVSASGMG